MEQTGEYRIAGDREAVWRALNDPAVLQRCLDGCRSMTPTGEDEFEAEVGAKVGPVRATFTAVILLRDVTPPTSYRLEVQVKGGAAGFAKGTAVVNLSDAAGGDTTVLNYRIQGAIGGKLAQIGSRLVGAAARKMTGRFFERFAADFASTSRSEDNGE